MRKAEVYILSILLILHNEAVLVALWRGTERVFLFIYKKDFVFRRVLI